jgi:tellurite methyltransferase
MDFKQLNSELGNADILLIDQILRGNFSPGIRMLDAGCGEGRNMVYFIRNGFQIYGIDADPRAVSMARILARSISKSYVTENIMQANIEDNPFPEEFFDLVICINVLPHARDLDHLSHMLDAMARILKKDGMLYIVMENRICPEMENQLSASRSQNDIEKRKKIYLTEELMNEIFFKSSLEKTEQARIYQVENAVSLSGLWFRKI